MFNFDDMPVPSLQTVLPGPNAKDFLERDRMYVSPSYTRDYPLVVKSGSGAVIEDVDGNLFLDFTAGIAVTNTGHCHPEVVAAIKDQAETLIHMSGTDFYYGPQVDLAERLAKLAPGTTQKKVFFCNSGTEANEAALKLSRWHTKRNRVVSFFGSFHGRTYGSMSLSGSKKIHRQGFSPLVPDVHHVGYPKNGDWHQTMRDFDCLFSRVCPANEVAAIFVEVVQGEGGYHVAPDGFLKALRDLCDANGMLLVFDEVQSGMGRTGRLFASNYFDVEPDILCTAKGIASGLPLGAIIAKSNVMDWPPGSHASTFGGNPVACRAALTTLDLLQREYIENSNVRGLQLREGLSRLAAKYKTIDHVRGLGLMVAVDVVPRSPYDRSAIIDNAYTQGLLLLGCGENGIRFCPPLCVTEAQVNKCLEILDKVLYVGPK